MPRFAPGASSWCVSGGTVVAVGQLAGLGGHPAPDPHIEALRRRVVAARSRTGHRGWPWERPVQLVPGPSVHAGHYQQRGGDAHHDTEPERSSEDLLHRPSSVRPWTKPTLGDWPSGMSCPGGEGVSVDRQTRRRPRGVARGRRRGRGTPANPASVGIRVGAPREGDHPVRRTPCIGTAGGRFEGHLGGSCDAYDERRPGRCSVAGAPP